MLNKRVFLFLCVWVWASYSVAEETAFEPAENIASCAMMDGNLSHSISRLNDGTYLGLVSFPLGYRLPSEETLEKSKKAWAEWDGGKLPEDPRLVGAGVPLNNENFMSFDLNRIKAKSDFFEKLFPVVKQQEYVSIEMSRLFLDFAENECLQVSAKGFTKVICQNQRGFERNGVKVDKVQLELSNKIQSEILIAQDGTPLLSHRLLVDAKLTLFSDSKYYESSFTYRPNGDTNQCDFKSAPKIKKPEPLESELSA